MERRSAFHAIYSTGFIPLIFEMEPTRDIKDQIDGLVDRADLFLGIYYQSFGLPQRDLYDLTPIQYELFRFLTRFDLPAVIRTGNSRITPTQARTIDEHLKDPDYLKALHRRLSGKSRSVDDPLHVTLARRVRLFRRIHSVDHYVTLGLADFLAQSRKNDFSIFHIPSLHNVHEDQFFPPHITLFETVQRLLLKALKEHSIVRESLDIRRREALSIDVKGNDHPGILYKVLRSCLKYSLNVSALSVDVRSKRVSLLLILEPLFGDMSRRELEAVGADLCAEIERFQFALTASCQIGNATERAAQTGLRRPDGMLYEVHGADVPGLVMEIAMLITAWGGNINFISFEGRKASETRMPMSAGTSGNRYKSGVFGIVPAGDKARIASPEGRRQFEFMLRSLIGVTDVRECGGTVKIGS